MAFTERELEISNKSYTNKDFASIYEELLTYAEKLSDRFSPTTAVESDPFIVLLKLASFVADKVNYQVDKNILERFISSCTQEQSMRELTETLGYNMHYYVAAETDVIFSYKLSDILNNDIEIPKYSVIETASKIPYITTRRSVINKDTKKSDAIAAIQGKIQSLNVLGNNLIQLENLDLNNRLYFPEVMVAENGVFITSAATSEWFKVNNLNTQTYGSTVYKFGFDSKLGLPYIEFPDWIADIIGEGLTIDYVVTQGKTGNVAAKDLNIIKKRTAEADDGIKNDDLRVVNLSASFSGADPETIDQSYLGFKKIIGTFDTLVTCRDYANAIYNMLTQGTPIVSNVQVSDRRIDINFAADVATFNPSLGTVVEAVPMKTNVEGGSNERKDLMTPFDLAIYPFNAITNTSINAIRSETDGFNSSFNIQSDDKINNIIDILERNSSEYKSINHTFKTLGANDIVSVQNFYELTATISTTSKVNSLEQADIIARIYEALAAEFNARKLNFGHEIPFSELLIVMENADARIKAVSLQEPIQTPKIITKNGNAYDIYNEEGTEDTDQFKFIVAKNVLAGRASLFDYDLDFTYAYDYETITRKPNIKTITTEANLPALTTTSDATTEYVLKANEAIQFISPNLLSDKSYTAGVYYHLTLAAPGVESISADAEYQLKDGDTLNFNYKQNDKWITDTIEAGSIISPNSALYTTTYLQNVDHRIGGKDVEGLHYYTLLSGEQVEIKKVNSEIINTAKKCYWITNKPDNQIVWSNFEYTLQENEYFFYSAPDLTSLFAVGSGTKLTIKNTMTNWDWTCKTDVNIDDITLEGLYALNDAFKEITFSNTNSLKLVENEILTLTTGDTIRNDSPVNDTFNIIDNTFETIGDVKVQYKYKTDTQFTDLADKSSIIGGNWSCRALLDINCGPDLEQELVGNQIISYEDASGTTGTLLASSDDILKFNILIQRGGGIDLDLGYVTLNNLEEKVYPTLLTIAKDAMDITATPDGMFVPEFDANGNAKFYAASLTDREPYIMLHITNIDAATLNAYDADNNLIVGSNKQLKNGINIIKLTPTNAHHWILNRGDTTSTRFIMSQIKYVKGKNPLLGLKTPLTSFVTYMEERFPEQSEKFYSLSDLDPSKQIELSVDYPLSHAQAFYDSNNIANKWVLPKIDFSAGKIKIVIARSSTKQ